ncbi:MAG: glycosyltransferase [Spirochaetaceae bacterium]|jgi:GT2 family glycosyltransferase|nr:glycosyltransferase [Spirochaetaceae bacterium]
MFIHILPYTITSQNIYIKEVNIDTRQWYFFYPEDILLPPHFFNDLKRLIKKNPAGAFFYFDEEWSLPDGSLYEQIKPDLNITLLYSSAYIGNTVLCSGTLLRSLAVTQGIFPLTFFYQMAIKSLQYGFSIEHTKYPRIRHPNCPVRIERDEMVQVFNSLNADTGLIALGGLTDHSIMIKREWRSYPELTICIPTRQKINDDTGELFIQECIKSISKSTWPRDKIKIIIGDNSGKEFYDKQDGCFTIEYLRLDELSGDNFNYAKIVNILWKQAQTEFIIFLNDDTIMVTPDWIESLASFALESDVGVCGPVLYYPNGTFQHAGFAGINGNPQHLWIEKKFNDKIYEGWASVQREWSAITGAVMATRRSVLEELNGFDELFPYNFNDIDLCYKMRMRGLRVVYNPAAKFIHHESATRGKIDKSPQKAALTFSRRWKFFLFDDPMLPKEALKYVVEEHSHPSFSCRCLKRLKDFIKLLPLSHILIRELKYAHKSRGQKEK